MIQAILIPSNYFNLRDAIGWIKNHKYEPLKLHITKNYYRFRINAPKINGRFSSIKLPNNIILVNQS